jgi:hypothetical protein
MDNLQCQSMQMATAEIQERMCQKKSFVTI